LDQKEIEAFEHPQHSPDLVLSNLFMFPKLKLKISLRGSHLHHLKPFRLMWQYWNNVWKTISRNICDMANMLNTCRKLDDECLADDHTHHKLVIRCLFSFT
jgi:hypothetical protein